MTDLHASRRSADGKNVHRYQWSAQNIQTVTTHLVFNEGGEGEVVEKVSEESPNVGVAVFPQALVVKAIDLRDLSGFVISTEDGDTVAVPQLESDEERDGLDRVVASVDVVTHKEVVCVR